MSATSLNARAKIVGVGAYAPQRVLTNRDLETLVETSDQWIVQRTGIRQRHVAAECEAASDLGIHAARQALERAGVAPGDVDFIVVGTTTADRAVPTTANVIQHRLGCRSVGSLDLYAACAASIYSLSVGSQYVQTGKYRTVLCVGTEVLSRITDYTDRGTCILLGDAAGAAVLRPSDDGSGILDADLYSDGAYGELLSVPAGGSRIPPSHRTVEERLHYIKMEGNSVFKVAVRTFAECAERILARQGFTVADLNLFIPHQANLRIIEAAAKRIGLPMEKVLVNVDRYGNTGAASVYVAMEEAWARGRLRSGDLVLLAAFGGGFTWGAALLRW
jgi:3-oxoacyl-[acyl-carrier-protein] synthase III